MKRAVAYAILAMFGIAFAVPVMAARGDLVASYSSGGRKLTLDPYAHRVYVANTTQSRVDVYDSRTSLQLGTTTVGSSPMSVAVSTDGSKVYVANSGEASITVVDSTTITATGAISAPWKLWDIKVGSGGYLYVTQGLNSGYHGILKIDASTGQVMSEFGGSYYRGMLEISPDQRYLYYSDRGLSPATATKYDVSGATPIQVAACSGLGSNGQDIALSHDGTKLYWGMGGWSGSGYRLPELATSDMQMTLSLPAPQCTCLAFSPTDRYLYSVSGTNGEARIWDLSSSAQIGSIPISEGAWDIAVNETGTRLFVTYDSGVEVFDTGFAPVPEPAGVIALIAGLLGSGLLARLREA